MLERIIVGKDVLANHKVSFTTERKSYELCDEPDDFLCTLTCTETGVGVRWLQGDDDLCYPFFRNYMYELTRVKSEVTA